MLAYMKCAPDIKQAIFIVNGILLEKVQHNKPNLRDITMKVLLCMLKRDKAQSLNPELFKRFKNKNTKIATFSMEVAVEALRSSLYTDENTLRSVFKATQDCVGHTSKEIRDIASLLMIEVYKLCSDDASAFTRNLKGLRPI